MSCYLVRRIIGWLRSEETSRGHLLQLPCSGKATYSQLTTIASRWLSNTSKNRESTTSLGNLTVKCFVMFRRNLLCFILCPLPLLLCHWAPLKRAGSTFFAPSLLAVWFYMYLVGFFLIYKNERFPPCLLFSSLNSPSYLSLSS